MSQSEQTAEMAAYKPSQQMTADAPAAGADVESQKTGEEQKQPRKLWGMRGGGIIPSFKSICARALSVASVWKAAARQLMTAAAVDWAAWCTAEVLRYYGS
ncbi:uncharacterized protein AB675_8883 [Cyphellophora attinorum]|uniref:Uncharacterized protein n=1 Tax=Cyphellophora attinorum TaxID=1664694 RepID=A0A0N0NIR6_9EURO|nr:uncharacterized protein AB675_8883 [Phialophora attinorum]KPI36131.1 hypothetical protein AB675_8883 [Phialophora attinorum]